MPGSGIDSSEIERARKALSRYPRISQPAVERFVNRAAEVLLNSMRIHAPVLTGRTRTSLGKGASAAVWRIVKNLVQIVLKIGSAVTAGGRSYPAILDTSGRHSYARGSFAGNATMGWFSNAPQRTAQQLGRLGLQAAREILTDLSGAIG